MGDILPETFLVDYFGKFGVRQSKYSFWMHWEKKTVLDFYNGK